MLTGTARGNLAVFQCQPAKGNEDFAVFHHVWPVGDPAGQRHIGANHIRQEELCRAPAVVTQLIDAAAAGKVEAADQGAGMVYAARRRPAVGAVENRRGTVAIAHPAVLISHQIQRGIPVDLDKVFTTAQRAVTFFALG